MQAGADVPQRLQKKPLLVERRNDDGKLQMPRRAVRR
jgi:hypothetical protein